jgi:hypothetical protein
MASDKMEVSLSQADATDLPALAEINRLTYMQETISMIAFKNWPAETNMFNFFQSRIQQRMETPNSQVFKATTETGEIVGFICWTLEHEREFSEVAVEAPGLDPNDPTAKALEPMKHVFNMEFIKDAQGGVEALNKLIKGMKHYCEHSKPAKNNCSNQDRLVNFCCNTEISRERNWVNVVTTLS